MSDTVAEIWQVLEKLEKPALGTLFADPARVADWSTRLDLPGGAIRFDWSKTHLDAAHAAQFDALADAVGFKVKRGAMFAGEAINVTEGRAVEHTALRGIGRDTSVEEATALHLRMKSLVEAIHAGALGEVKHLIHIGIGGSALGPALAIDALTRDGAKVDVQVVSNIDGCALEAAFAKCDPATTLIAVASKTFTTTETMTNADSALNWLRENGVGDPYGRVVALTASPDRAVDWGVDETRVLPFPESVGGRFFAVVVDRLSGCAGARLGRFRRIPGRCSGDGPALPGKRWPGQPAPARGLCRSLLCTPARLPDAGLLCL